MAIASYPTVPSHDRGENDTEHPLFPGMVHGAQPGQRETVTRRRRLLHRTRRSCRSGWRSPTAQPAEAPVHGLAVQLRLAAEGRRSDPSATTSPAASALRGRPEAPRRMFPRSGPCGCPAASAHVTARPATSGRTPARHRTVHGDGSPRHDPTNVCHAGLAAAMTVPWPAAGQPSPAALLPEGPGPGLDRGRAPNVGHRMGAAARPACASCTEPWQRRCPLSFSQAVAARDSEVSATGTARKRHDS